MQQQLTKAALQHIERLRLEQSDHFLELVSESGELFQINKAPDVHAALKHRIVSIRNSEGITIPVPHFDGHRLLCFDFRRA